MRAWVALALVTLALAGCAEESGEGPVGTEGDEGPGEGQHTMQLLTFADASAPTEVSVGGTFQWQDNDQFMGEGHRRLGQEESSRHYYDVSGDIPVGVPVAFEIVARATSGTGDLDIWFESGVSPWSWHCDCPVGGSIDVFGSLIYDGSEAAVLVVQYDEIDDQPSFDYTVDLTFTTLDRSVPGGAPLVVPLRDDGDHVLISGHSQDVLVFDPRDELVETIPAGDQRVFAVDGNMSKGDHVFVQSTDGTPMQVHFGSLDGKPAPPARLLKTIDIGDVDTVVAGGESANLGFVAPSNVLALGVCVINENFVSDPAATLTGPDGVVAEIDGGDVQVMGWGGCFGVDRVDGDAAPGPYDLAVSSAGGDGLIVWNWVVVYER